MATTWQSEVKHQAAPGSASLTWATLDQMVAAQASRFPHRTAILSPGRDPLSFGRLDEQIRATRSQLWELGIGRGDVVASALSNGPEAGSVLLGASSAATFAPLNPNLVRSEYESLFGELAPKILLAQPGQGQTARRAAMVAKVPIVEVIPQAEAGAYILVGPKGSDHHGSRGQPAEPGDRAYILSTSGSTGRPKLAPTTHRAMCTSINIVREVLALTPDDRCLNFSPLFHALGLVSGILLPLCTGGSTVFTRGFRVDEFFEWLDQFRPTWFSAVPTVLQEILEHAPQHADVLQRCPIRFVRSGGAALAPSVAEQIEAGLRAPMMQTYGLSEAPYVSMENVRGPRRRGASGRPTCGEVAIVDAGGRALPPGEPGEIVVRGPTVFEGYYGNPQATQAAFRGGWFHTADIGHLDADGFLFITGRANEFINRGGEKIAPLEVDQVLFAHPAVAKAVTFSVPHDKLGEDVAAAVVLREGASVSEPQLLEFASEHLAAHKLPRRILFLDRLPVGPTGKVLRSKMRAHVASLTGSVDHPPSAYVKPRDDRERRIAGILARVLRLDRVGIHDNFFQLGGDSLAATEAALLLEEDFGLTSLSPGMFHWAPTVAQLAGILADPARLERPYDVIPLQTEGHGVPLFLIEPGDEGPRIARHLGQEHPFYGIPIPASADPSRPRSIEQMASECIAALRRFQPEGPYALTGWCAHGAIALEMAQQLEQHGAQVSFVTMLDVRNFFLPPLSAPHLAWVKFWRRFRRALFAARHWPGGTWGRMRSRIAREPAGPVLETTLALRRYRPRPWRGRMVHIWCTVWARGRYFQPSFGWNHLAPEGFVFHEVAGDHLTFIQEPSVAEVARILADELDRAQPSQQPRPEMARNC
ncbi:MAG: AMP-binding protein [Acidobacteriia bacterium]|nr:AMP-binding protein [Terriglobia bacterium]